jgi:hypothetical protein
MPAKKHLAKVVQLLAMFLYSLVCAWPLGQQKSLNERLDQIERQAATGTSLGKTEAEALELTKVYPSPKDVGTVYAHIAFMYARRSAPYQQTAKVIAYATMALKYPVDLADEANVYLDWGTAIMFKYWPGEEYLQHRREVVIPLLTGLKLLLDKGVPEKIGELPAVGKFDVPENDPHYQEIVKKHQQQEEVRKKAEEINKLAIIRIALTSTIFSLYAFGADATPEMKELASQILKNDAAVAALAAKTKSERAKHVK